MQKLIDFCLSNGIECTIRKDILMCGIRFEFKHQNMHFVRCIPYDRCTDAFTRDYGIKQIINELKSEFDLYLEE